ncbi:MAG: hypothetical protein R3C99_19165 [Pirellulaceae bacterium]|nr:hypothetical protein [Planctomycetales bacterium]MCA9219710.1 hypothetical protein [Planctomycetales bacterium]
MTRILRLFRYDLTSPRLDAKVGQILCWLSSAGVMTLGMWKLTRLQVTEKELFFGVLLVLAVSLLGVVLGMLLPLVEDVSRRQRDC